MNIENKTALIVEGGGFRSAFTAGIIDTFIVSKFYPFNLCVGVSGGAMNLTSYISRQYKRNINIISSMCNNSNFISIARFLKGGNFLELKYLFDYSFKKYPFDSISANNFLVNDDCKMVVTNYDNGRANYLSVKEFGWIKLVEATSSLPIAIRGYCEIGSKKYIDGGIADPLPVKKVYNWGYKKIVLLRTHPKDMLPDWNIESLYAPFFFNHNPKLKKIVIKNDKIYNNALNFINKPPNDVQIFQLYPKRELKCGVLSNNIEKIISDYQLGLEVGLDFLSQNKIINS